MLIIVQYSNHLPIGNEIINTIYPVKWLKKIIFMKEDSNSG